ncbi:hypothetical protein EGH22_20395 [Halomicroarcula sp. F28]|uniref:hypothetical protein n=1 Tax=Haloarcula salinisoli TaxID=2487746 RepID=UPI001C72B14D|nr:hypothetical protein [Halomicroarcula salinisoli]MBX0288694.1 hypothetical protein [Halomicroarcula salinisoli]
MPDEFNADPTREWDTTLSERHKEIDTKLDNRLDAFIEGEEYNPLAVVGPYGAGKTQFLYEVLRRGWNQGLPALYTDLKTILEAHEDVDEPIVDWLERRTTEEIGKLEAGEKSDWLPESSFSERESDFYDEFIAGTEISTDKCILLIDEVEQKYEQFDEYTDVDDENPLRDILDNLTDIFQVWSFGLVSAYEVIGEADRRRFDEVRIPITEVGTVRNQLRQKGKPTSIANGVWWVARGRAGWISNHSNSLPDVSNWNEDTIETWVDEASNQTYYGAESISSVWSEQEISASDIPAAKRTVLFENPAYDEWTIEGGKAVIQVSTAHEVLLDAIQNQSDVKGDEYEIIYSNLLDVLRGFSPPSAWVTEEEEVVKMYLPSEAFSRPANMRGFISTVSDFVASFEKRGDARKEVTRILSELDIDSLSNTWSNLYDVLEKPEEEEVEVWTVEPPIVNEAYKPLALNPESLTDTATTELYDKITTPVEFDPQVRMEGAELEVQLCPTEAAFENLCGEIATRSDIAQTTAVLLPDVDRADWEIPNHMQRLQEYNLVTIEKVGGERLWDFVLQLQHYLEQHGYSQTLTQELIEETVVPNAEEDEVRNTITALFNELNRVGTETAQAARAAYNDAFTLPEINGFIWEDSALAGKTPYYGTTSTSTFTKHGLEYGMVFAPRTIDQDVPYQQLFSSLWRAYNNDYADDKRWFRSDFFFDRAFTSDGKGISDDASDVRSKYVTEGGELRRPVERLQEALVYLCEMHGEGIDRIYNRVARINLDEYTDEEELSVLQAPVPGENQTEDVFRGLLLHWALRENPSLLEQDLEDISNELKRLDSRIDNVARQVTGLNDDLQHPIEIEEIGSIQLRESTITEYKENIGDVREGIEELAQALKQHPKLAPALAVFWSITERYVPMMEEVVDNLQTTLGNVDLYQNIPELKAEYKKLRQWANRLESLDGTLTDQPQFHQEIQRLGQVLFDFPTRLGTQTLAIENSELLDELDGFVRRDINQLSKLNKQTEKIDKEAKKSKKLAGEISDSLQAFANTTSVPGGSQ